MTGQRPLRFGVVGTGYWAREVHVPGVASHPDADLVGVWGRDSDKAAQVAQKHGAAGYADLDALVDAVDAMVFSVPPQVQAELAVRVAEAGRHLLLEKPLATSLASADLVVDAVQRSGVSSVVFFTERFVPDRERWLVGLGESGCLGGQATWLASLQTPDNPFAGSPWRKQDGALWDVGPHALSVLLPVLGPVTDVAGARGPGDLVQLVLTHQGGSTSTVGLSLTMPPAAQRFGLEFFSEDGWHARPDRSFDVLDAQRGALTELVENARRAQPDHRCDVRFGREVVAVLDRAEHMLGAR